MAQEAHNEGFYLGLEVSCSAIPGNGIDVSRFKGRCANAGFLVSQATDRVSLSAPLTPQRKAQLQNLPTKQLAEHLENSGQQLSADELRFLHTLAVDRMDGSDASHEAVALCRRLMEIAAQRIAP